MAIPLPPRASASCRAHRFIHSARISPSSRTSVSAVAMQHDRLAARIPFHASQMLDRGWAYASPARQWWWWWAHAHTHAHIRTHTHAYYYPQHDQRTFESAWHSSITGPIGIGSMHVGPGSKFASGVFGIASVPYWRIKEYDLGLVIHDSSPDSILRSRTCRLCHAWQGCIPWGSSMNVVDESASARCICKKLSHNARDVANK